MGRKGSGVEARGSSIRVQFVLDDVTYRERVTVNGKSLPPTPANIKYATRLVDEIKRKIALGTFNFSDFFPDSKHAKQDEDSTSTFGQIADLWIKSKGTLSKATIDQYGTAVRFWKGLLGSSTKIDKLTHKMIAAKVGGYPWPSAKTHNNYLIALRGILDMEYRGQNAANNPIIGIGNMQAVKKLPDPLTADERDKILADIESHYDKRVFAYFLFMFYTGMRPEEAIALRWSDIDWNTQIARIQRVRTFKGSERDGSKTHTERDIDLMPQAIEALKIMKPHTFMLKTDREGDNAADIFQNPVTGRPWHDERSQRDHYWKPALKRTGIRFRRAYNTRHTYATAALMKGIPPAYIASQLGNSVKILLDRYARWIPNSDNGSARSMMIEAMKSGNSSQIHPKEKTGTT